jgi:hypothetical protein
VGETPATKDRWGQDNRSSNVALRRLSVYSSDAIRAGYGLPPGDFGRKLREAAASARIPAELHGSVWRFHEEDLHEIAAEMGLEQREALALARAA